MAFKHLSSIVALSLCAVLPVSLQAQPEIIVDPMEIERILFSGDREEFMINIFNAGDQALIFRIEPEIIAEPNRDLTIRSMRQVNGSDLAGPRRDDLGDVIDEFRLGEAPWTGLAWDGELMWGLNMERPQMIAFDPVEEEEVETVELNNLYFGMAYDGEMFWACLIGDDDNTRIQRIERNGDVNQTINVNGMGVFGVAYDGENLWYSCLDDRQNNFLVQITTEGEVLREINCNNIFNREFGITIAWVTEHEDGNIWAIS